ncbi:molybdate ABC transporter substrate-binding protein [Hydrocarboniphaga effusa]|uniref:Molybdenum ABC transporter periplasmic molybdate-binding protein n=1 Tax=Hydrocarboniphaga effusa AP103 TaxID=1172194 RepID=I8T519_9GAMM|nr:molybdate ABC transporter substrate-binding protein [Hydrocarboniphaga effusa]EIT68990.1 molybdenum ABC transporter periplasmic molybdate-binding protein [Hydrocarboniphaga effusa AP103]
MRLFLRPFVLALLLCSSLTARAEEAVRVFAAASLTSALTDIAAQWKQGGHTAPTLAFAASSALAKQIEAGAPADMFASADRNWMDYLQQRGRIEASTRIDLLGNTLVLIAPKGRRFRAEMRRGFDFARAFDGKLCTGEPGVVPVGIYARQSLEALGWWEAIRPRIVGTDDVRTALNFVERGECAAGIVYATDAAISDKVEIMSTFPEDAHEPIVYPVALVGNARPAAREFLRYLHTSREAAATFERHGFTRLTSAP